MNPPNPFGSSQSGAFQAPSSAVKSTLLQPTFAQHPQQTGFFGTGFGHPSPSVFGQAPVFGQVASTSAPQVPSFVQDSSTSTSTSQQAPAFGQASTTPAPQAPSFGQQQTGSIFGSNVAPAFGQTTTSTNQSSVFGEAPSFGATFGQPNVFGRGFGGQTSGFGTQQTPQFEQAAAVSSSVGFGHSMFGQPTSTASSTSIFGTSSSNVTLSKGFGSSEFSFKPSNEALFKPIISASPEPTTTTMSSSLFGAASATSASTGLFSSAKPASAGFSFSQPATLPAAQPPLVPTSSNKPSSGLQFTFSQPASPSNKGTASVNPPSTPSSFSFSSKTLHSQTKPLFSASTFGQSFGEAKDKEDNDKESTVEPTIETNVFARLGKASDQGREDALVNSGMEKEVSQEGASVESDPARQQPKKPLARSRGPPPGLFGRALSGLRRDASGAPKREMKHLDWEETEGPELMRQRITTPPTTVAVVMREQMEKTKEPEPVQSTSTAVQSSPAERTPSRRDSSDSMGNSTVLNCRNLPPELNNKGILSKHFEVFGKIRRIYCKKQKNAAFVYFDDHASAVKAKKNGKMLHQHELLLLLHKKKQSPGDKGGRSPVPLQQQLHRDKAEPEHVQKQVQSPLRRAPIRPAALSSTITSGSPVKKSRALHFEDIQSEPTPEPPTLDRPVDRPVPSSLLYLIGQHAETAEDKYRLLEQRDKILRQGRPKRTDLNLSKVFVGTCPDMCPEKERFMRETRNQLSVFEVLPNTEMVDHAAAIKEYSRSSADQEEPLPHELRPLPVLSMTMDYLVTQIMDQGQDNYRDWYDFVWNRTRGIRKDITQQHLCCPDTVALIEKCTRFHVHCAHELCEEHMSSFDAKINNENMTKCLQSLKEMYEDLSTAGLYCPQEAEIRQYNVLLKLDDGDVLREVQQFRDSVRNSPEVKFAIQAFSAVNNNNFVRFFKLVKSASYLSSCLLHRYFNQVRSRGLRVLNVAYTSGNRSSAFPLDDIVQMLMFENREEASAFIQQHGLSVSDSFVELSRSNFQDPELPLLPRRSEVILSKRKVLVGEVVNGGPLPNPPEHRPVCSFDTEGKYRGEQLITEPPSYKASIASRPPAPEAEPVSLLAIDTLSGPALVQSRPPQSGAEETGEPSIFLPASESQFQPIPPAQPIAPSQPTALVKAPTPPPPKPVYSQEDIEAELNSMIEEVTDVTVREVADAAACYASAALEVSFDQVEALVCEVTDTLVKEISFNEIKLEQERVAEEKRRIEEARRKQEHESFLIDYSFSLCTELIYQVLDETIKKVAVSEIQQAVDEKAALIARCTEEVCAHVMEETLDTDISILVQEVLDIELQRIHKYIKRWRDVVSVRRQLKRQMRAFPAAPCFVDPRCKLKALTPSAQSSRELLAQGQVNLGQAGTLSVSTSRLLKIRKEVAYKLRVGYYHQLLLNQAVWAPLNLPALATKHLPNLPSEIFWKCLLLLPSQHETDANECDRFLCDWLAAKLGAERIPPPYGTFHSLVLSSSFQDTPHRCHAVHITIKGSSGPLSEDGLCKMEEMQELQGTAALLLLLPVSLHSVHRFDQDVPLLSALLQLKQLQQANTWHCPVPLVILVPGTKREEEQMDNLAEALMLPKLVEDGLISEYTFFFLPETISDLQGSKKLTDALCWLFTHAPPAPRLSSQTLVQLVESVLGREATSRIYNHRQDRAAASLPPQRPQPVIQLYNAVMNHIAECVSSPELTRLSWPPLEFCASDNKEFVPHMSWNSPEHLDWIRDIVLSLQLPPWDDLSPTDSWSELCSFITSYVAQLPTSCSTQPLLMSRLENLLEKFRYRLQTGRVSLGKVCWSKWAHGEEEMYSLWQSVPWDDVLEICIDHKLKEWHLPKRPYCEDAVMEDGNIIVYFLSDALNSFSAPDEWTEAIRHTQREKHQQQEGSCAAPWASPPSMSLQKRLFSSSKEPDHHESALNISYTPTAEEAQAHRVQRQLEEERQESKRMMDQLQRWSEGEAVLQLHFPRYMPSSTLLSTPTLQLPPPTGHARASYGKTTAQVRPKVYEPKNSSVLPLSRRTPLTPEDLKREIRSSLESERACKLHLSILQNIVDN